MAQAMQGVPSVPGVFEVLVILAVGLVMVGVPCCLVAYFLAKAKGRSPATWMPVCLFLPLLGLIVLALLPKGSGVYADNETRCRKCGYILRGITEPRCPECGQRI